MAWETALDRLILRQVHLAEKKEVRPVEVRRILTDLLELGKEKPRLAFHVGYAQAYLGIEVPGKFLDLEKDRAARRWYLFGQLRAHDKKGEKEWVAGFLEDKHVLYDLLREPGIAWGLLPLLMRTYFWEGDLEGAVSALEYLSLAMGGEEEEGGTRELVQAALTDLLTRVERRKEPEEGLTNREILRRSRAVAGFEELPPEVKTRFELAEGRSYLEACEWEEAEERFRKAAEFRPDVPRLASLAWTHLAWSRMQARNTGEVLPRGERPGREEILELLDEACKDPGKGAFEAFYTRGILLYEAGKFLEAKKDFETALGLSRRAEGVDPDTTASIRFYLAASILASGQGGEAKKAAHLMDQALDRVKPDLETFYTVHETLKSIDRDVALKFLDSVDVGRGTSPDNLLMVALEYMGLGEAEPARAAAARVLQVANSLDQRIEALKVSLMAANMTGKSGEAREAYEALRDLLEKRGRFEDLEKILLDENLVGQALDHIEIKCELIDIYEEMEGREADRARLQLAVARSLKAKKNVENLKSSLAILKELELSYPELAKEELDLVQKLLELGEGEEGEDPAEGDPRKSMEGLARKLGRPPFFMVIGGNERQRKHLDRFEELKAQWGFQGEWIMANYTSPQRPVKALEARLKKGEMDGLLLLHWNRHETTEPALALARSWKKPARTLYYAGFTSLQEALALMASQTLSAGEMDTHSGEEENPKPRNKGKKKSNPRKKAPAH